MTLYGLDPWLLIFAAACLGAAFGAHRALGRGAVRAWRKVHPVPGRPRDGEPLTEDEARALAGLEAGWGKGGSDKKGARHG